MSQQRLKSRPASKRRTNRFVPQLEVCEPRYAPGKAVEGLEPVFLLPILLDAEPATLPYSVLDGSERFGLAASEKSAKQKSVDEDRASASTPPQGAAGNSAPAPLEIHRSTVGAFDGSQAHTFHVGSGLTDDPFSIDPLDQLGDLLGENASRPRIKTDSDAPSGGGPASDGPGSSGGGPAGTHAGGGAEATADGLQFRTKEDLSPDIGNAGRPSNATQLSPVAASVPAQPPIGPPAPTPAQPGPLPVDPFLGYDGDADGVPREIELQAPHNGDGNRDNVMDYRQADVANLRASTTGDFVTLEALGYSLRNVHAEPGPRAAVDGLRLPLGLFGFEVHGVTPGGTATVRMILPESVQANAYLKENPATGLLERFDFDGTTGAEIDGSYVTLHLQDGGRGDADGLRNGIIVDPGGPGSDGTLITIPCPNPAGSLSGWTVVQSGGSGGGIGGVTAVDDDYYELREGNSFVVSLQRDFIVPANPSYLVFYYSNLNLDQTDPDSINDAFEVALVDSAGVTDVYPIASGRDAFFNVTEGMSAALGQGTELDTQTQRARVDISQLFPAQPLVSWSGSSITTATRAPRCGFCAAR